VAEVSASDAAALEARQLFRFYHAGNDETLALRGVSLSVERGEMVAVTGPSGSGKSTLLACLAGLDEPDGGVVKVAGATMSRRPEAERAALRARHLGMLFQHGNLIEHLTVTENVVLAQRLCGRADKSSVHSLLDELGLSTRRTARPSELSGGEGARAGLAVAMANAPSVLLADEPTGELDGLAQMRVLELLRARAEGGTAVVVVTHNQSVAAAADRQIRLLDGQVQS
jgi:putative ABC transport system ATP-binding protein